MYPSAHAKQAAMAERIDTLVAEIADLETSYYLESSQVKLMQQTKKVSFQA